MKDNKKDYKRIIVLLIFIIIILLSLLLFKSCRKNEVTNSPVSTTETETTTKQDESNTVVDESTTTETTTQKHTETNKKPHSTTTTESVTSTTKPSTTIEDITTSVNNTTTAVPGYEIIYLKADSKQQNVALENPSTNECYFKITLLLEDGTVLWKSNLIKPGKKSEAITLTQELPSGNYKAILRYECYSMDGSMRQMNGAETKLSLRVN